MCTAGAPHTTGKLSQLSQLYDIPNCSVLEVHPFVTCDIWVVMSLDTVFQSIRFQITQLTKSVTEEEGRKKRQWRDDAEALEAYISALSATKAVLKAEQNTTLQRVNRLIAKREAEEKLPTASAYTKQEVQEKLKEFRTRIKEAETRVEQAAATLTVAERSEERCLLQDQILIMGVRSHH